MVSVQLSLDGIDTGPAVNWAQLLLTLAQLRVETGPLAFPGASTDPVTLLRPAGRGRLHVLGTQPRAVMFYLDSAAVVKLVHSEPESETLRAWLAERAETGWVSSVLVEVESFRALARHSPGAISRLPSVLDLIEMVEIDPAVRIAAHTVAPASVGSLDAIHLATALRLAEQLTSFVTYDKRLADAAEGAGLRVDMPVQ